MVRRINDETNLGFINKIQTLFIPIKYKRDIDTSKYFLHCDKLYIDNLPKNTSITSYLMIHKPSDLKDIIFTTKEEQDIDILLNRINHINNHEIYSYILAGKYPNIYLYLVPINTQFKFGTTHMHLGLSIGENDEIYIAGEMMILKTTMRLDIISFNFKSDIYDNSINNALNKENLFQSYLYDIFGLIINGDRNRLYISHYDNIHMNIESLNTKKLYDLCKKMIIQRSDIPYYLVQKSVCDNPVLDNFNYDNNTFIDPIQIEMIVEPLLCDTIIKYYNAPKISLNGNDDILRKYNIDLSGLPYNDIYTDEKINAFKYSTFIKFNSYFDISDYIKIDPIQSLINNDKFNNRLYDLSLYNIIKEHNKQYLFKYSDICLQNYIYYGSRVISNLATLTDTVNNVYPSEQFLKYNGYTDNRIFNGKIQLSEILPYSNNAIHRNEISYIKNIDTNDYYETEDNYVYYTNNDINIKVSKDLDSNNSSLKILSYNIHNWTRIIPFKNYHNIHIDDTQPAKNISDIVLHGTSVITSVNPLQFSDSIPNENLQYRNIKPFMQLFNKMNADILLLQEITPQHNRYDEVKKEYLPDFPQEPFNGYDAFTDGTYNFNLINQEMEKLGYKHKFISNTLFRRLKAPHEPSGFYWIGNAIYSKLPFLDSEAYKLDYNRTCIFVVIEYNYNRYIIATLHLSINNEAPVGVGHRNKHSYVQQLESATGLLIKYMLKHNIYNVILGGDFNHISSVERDNLYNSILIRQYAKGFMIDLMNRFNERHFTGFNLKNIIDRFLISPEIVYDHDYDVGYFKSLCSDHYPIFLHIRPFYQINKLSPYPIYIDSDILNKIASKCYSNMVYASSKSFNNIHYCLTNIDLGELFGLNIYYTMNSLITVIYPNNHQYLDIKLINIDEGKMEINIDINDYRTLVRSNNQVPNDSMLFIQDAKNIYQFLFRNFSNKFSYIKFNENSKDWITIKNIHIDYKLVGLDITKLSDDELVNLFKIKLFDHNLTKCYNNTCNLIIIKYNNHHIYIHNIKIINYNFLINLLGQFKNSIYIYVVFDLIQISINNSSEVIHFTSTSNQ
jgi:endonuclease/exonuclease/phosphatase family metal-dependent hydrolase